MLLQNLFYGPPGTAKAGLPLALAGELKLNLHIFSLGAVTDETLGQLFQTQPRKCIVLLESIDCAGIGRGSTSNLQGFMNPYENSIGNPAESEEEAYTQSRQSDQQLGADSSATSELAGKRTSSGNCRSGDAASLKTTDSEDKLTLDTTHLRMSMNSM